MSKILPFKKYLAEIDYGFGSEGINIKSILQNVTSIVSFLGTNGETMRQMLDGKNEEWNETAKAFVEFKQIEKVKGKSENQADVKEVEDAFADVVTAANAKWKIVEAVILAVMTILGIKNPSSLTTPYWGNPGFTGKARPVVNKIVQLSGFNVLVSVMSKVLLRKPKTEKPKTEKPDDSQLSFDFNNIRKYFNSLIMEAEPEDSGQDQEDPEQKDQSKDAARAATAKAAVAILSYRNIPLYKRINVAVNNLSNGQIEFTQKDHADLVAGQSRRFQ